MEPATYILLSILMLVFVFVLMWTFVLTLVVVINKRGTISYFWWASSVTYIVGYFAFIY